VNAGIATVFLHVTKACSLRCRYCYFSAARPDPDEMTREEYARLWPSIVAVRPAKLVFTGGEPLVRPDLLELVADLAEADAGHALERCLNTNGIGMTSALAERLVGLIDEMRVSLDGPADVHDRLRGKGSFAAAVGAIEMLRAEGFEPKILVTITADSVGVLPSFLEWLAARGLTCVRLNPVRLTGRAAAMPELAVATTEIAATVARARAAVGRHSFPCPPPSGLARSCGAGYFVNVMPNGDVFPCHVLTDPAFRVGNVRRRALDELIGGGSVLGRLRDLDLREVARESGPAARALERLTCLGEVRSQPAVLHRVARS
jgi:MoaA/NifB/PqqE/SkfB family radical SAM enzyme